LARDRKDYPEIWNRREKKKHVKSLSQRVGRKPKIPTNNEVASGPLKTEEIPKKKPDQGEEN